VKPDDQGPGKQAQETVGKRARTAQPMQGNEEFGPRTMLKHV